jgi:hypothetical protein
VRRSSKGWDTPKGWSSDEVIKLMAGKSDRYMLHHDDSKNTALHHAAMRGGDSAVLIAREWVSLCSRLLCAFPRLLAPTGCHPMSFGCAALIAPSF